MQAGDDPVVVWGTPAAHFCLGQHQSAAAELITDPHVPVIRRPLGGGGVWLDRHQACMVLIAPRDFFPNRTEGWYAHALAPMLQVYSEMGWAASLVQQDVWLNGKKLAGSGAATIGSAGVVGTSFLLKFPADEFTQLIAVPSAGFRSWLSAALQEAITSWSEHAPVPELAWLSLVYRRAATGIFGWRWEQAMLRDDERAARDEYRAELVPENDTPNRLVPHGIKINAQSFLTEQHFDGRWVRVLTQGQTIARVAMSHLPQLPEHSLTDIALTEAGLGAVLQDYLPAAVVPFWAQCILTTAHFADKP
ncbi:lipoate--protein ligase family protein [Sulfuriferula thiophila]|uniref:lipoate--protein ligase family protein n=1 Tax=Sulfuriferula thiophila TaxID=1781211 RepID=UPI001671C387|nr:lipoate--protein ligase family protein [Sulfuriferula thiophila]